jgi:localization factor PodJL
MTARTSWRARAEQPPHRDIEPVPGASHRPLFEDLLDSRFDETGRLVRRSGETRSRVAERLGRDLPDVGAGELEEAVEHLSRQVAAAAEARAAGQANTPPHEPGHSRDEWNSTDRRSRPAPGPQTAEPEPPAIVDVLSRLEARLEALSERAGRRRAGDADRETSNAALPDRAPDRPLPERRAAPEGAGRDRRQPRGETHLRHPPAGEPGIGAVQEALDGLAQKIEALHRNDRSLSRAMEAIHGQLGDIGERLGRAEFGPAALSAVERSFEHILERMGQLERAPERAAAPAELTERLERLRRHVQALPGREALAALEDRILELAERLDAAVERGAGGRAIERLEAQLDDIAGALTALKQTEQTRARDIETRLSELMRRVETAPRGAPADMTAIEARLEDILARLDGVPAPQFAEAVGSLEARLDGLARALDERPQLDLDSLTRQLKELQGRLDKVSRAVSQGGGPGFDAEPLHRRLEEIQQRLEAGPGDGELTERLRAIEERLAGLSQPTEPDLDAVRAQLAALAGRLDGTGAAERPDADRMTALMERLEALLQTIGGEDRLAGIGETIGKISAALDAMSDAPALEDIAELRTEIALLRREMKSLPGGGAAAGEELAPLLKDLARRLDRQPAEPPLTVADLESQIDRIVRMMEEPAPERLSLGPIEDSLRRIEEQLESGARTALPSALAQMPDMADSEADSFTRLVSALSADLGALKDAATSSQRNMRETLASVHDALDGVARRIAALESPEPGGSAPRPLAAPAAPLRQAPPSKAGQQARPAPIPEIALGSAAPQRPPAAPIRQERTAEDAGPAAASPQGLLGRLTSGQLLKRATGGRTESFSPAAEEADEGLDLPLEPGTEEPMSSTLENAPSSDTARFAGAERRRNRVPGRAGAINRRDPDGGYVADDFLSAARRAAQAAAIEAAEAERTLDTDEQVGVLARLIAAMTARRRILLAGALAIAVAFAAWQYLDLRAGGGSRIAQAPVTETGRADEPAQSAGPAEAQPAEPSRPDSTLAFGEPLALPGELQRRQELEGADLSPDRAPERPPAAAPAPDDRPPESIGPEALRRAAAEGDPAAQFEVAARFAEGRGVTQDLDKAAEWYRRAAEGGLAPAQYRLGSIHEKGIGVPRDPAAAMEWYRRAAEAGNAKAMHNLAVLYAEGIGGGSDLERAAEWFRRAAERGVRDSQFNIGVLHARGLGVPQDLIEAYKWFAVASQSGDAQAEERRRVLAQSLSEADLAKARAAASAFRPLMLEPAANVVEQPEGGWGDPPAPGISLGGPDLVRQVQDLLAARGYDVGTPDGRFGPRTRSAVAAFQEEMGLPATGEIDAGVVIALQQYGE